jgi:hypothetical protein
MSDIEREYDELAHLAAAGFGWAAKELEQLRRWKAEATEIITAVNIEIIAAVNIANELERLRARVQEKTDITEGLRAERAAWGPPS